MPTFQSHQLLAELSSTVRDGITQAERLRALSPEQWQTPAPNSKWSPTQHLHHLNFYADFYTDSIARSIEQAKAKKVRPTFRAGWLGDYFTRIIGPAPADGQLKMKMKSPANAVPPDRQELDGPAQLRSYQQQQQRLLELLQKAQRVDLGRNRAATSLSPWLRLKLGDTFRFVIAHQERHFQVLKPVLQPRATDTVQR